MRRFVRVPLVDLTATFEDGSVRNSAVESIRHACEEVGFFVVSGHGIPDDVIDNVRASSTEFFAQPQATKLLSATETGVFRGFVPSEASALAHSRDISTPPDLCESYSVNRFDDPADAVRAGRREGNEEIFAPNVWPEHPEGFRSAFEAYYAAMESLAEHLMSLLALALDLDEHWFDDEIRDHITTLTVNHYPAINGDVAAGQFRRGEHSDWGSLTILHHDGEQGLQIMAPDGDWEGIEAVADSFVINLGDLMATWTNDRWVSTVHRVVVPDGGAGDRLSVAFFHQPAYDALIECIPSCTSADDPPRHEPITSGEWIVAMARKSGY